MRIKKLRATGLKIGDFDHDLEAVNIVTGKNFAGKTARLDAIRLGLLGYLPELGKQATATAALARNGSMSVELVMDTGQSVRRVWKTERGSFKGTVESTLGDVPAVLMDPNEYFSLGEKDRVRYVFGLAKVGGTVSKITDVIWANLKGIRVENHGPQHEKAIRALGDVVACLRLPPQELVEQLTADFRDRLKLAKQNATRMSQTVQGLTALKAADDEQSIKNVDATLAAARQALSDRSWDLRSLNEQIARLEVRRMEREKLSDVLVRTPDAVATVEAMEREQAELLARTESREMQVTDALWQEQTLAAQKVLRIRESITRLEHESAERKAKHEAVIAHKRCPVCGTSGKGWKEHIISDFAHDRKSNEAELELLNASVVLAQKTVTDVNTRYQAAIRHDKALADNQRRLAQLSRELITFRSGQKDTEALRAKIEAMGPVTELEDIATLETLRTAVSQELIKVQSQIKDLEVRQKTFHQAKQDEARNAQALLQHAAVMAEKDVLAEAVKMLEALQAEMVRQAFGPLLERANAVTEGILKTPLEYRDGELGRFEGASWDGERGRSAGCAWITHRTFSGTEKAIAYVGISVALAADSPIRIVMIDELGRLDVENKRRLLERMCELTDKGVIDQFVGIDSRPGDYLGMQWVNVIEV